MPPPVESWPASQLESRVQWKEKSSNLKKRKEFEGELEKCELLELLQYKCAVGQQVTQESVVKCWPVERLFRRCKDREGNFMVETTAWEGGGKRG